MAAEGTITEALARIEHKVDVLLELLTRVVKPGNNFLITPIGDSRHTCPVCTQTVAYAVDIINRAVLRQCGCKTGRTPPIDLGPFAPPSPVAPRDNKEKSNGIAERDE